MPFKVCNETKEEAILMKSQKGVTLITLILTIVIILILTFTFTINIVPYKEQKMKSNFENDIQTLNEEINQYYTRVKKIPILNAYENISMLEGIRNLNDNDNYYVIDIRQLDVKLNYGLDYKTILERGIEADITDLTDVYIINEQSHTIYYPKGIEYRENVHYRLPEVYSKIS